MKLDASGLESRSTSILESSKASAFFTKLVELLLLQIRNDMELMPSTSYC